jgi:hypothetical protein
MRPSMCHGELEQTVFSLGTPASVHLQQRNRRKRRPEVRGLDCQLWAKVCLDARIDEYIR